MRVNAETLQGKISGLQESLHIGGALSLNQEYQLEAYKMLLQRLSLEELTQEYPYDPD